MEGMAEGDCNGSQGDPKLGIWVSHQEEGGSVPPDLGHRQG